MNFLDNLYFRRIKRQRGEEKDYFDYELNKTTRNQISFVLKENIDQIEYREIIKRYTKEIGAEYLFHKSDFNNPETIEKYVRDKPTEEVFSFIEFIIHIKLKKHQDSRDTSFVKIILEINKIFQLNKLGYEIVNVSIKDDLKFMIIPFYSKYLHNEVIKKPITLLYNHKFEGPLQEFEKALDDFREENYSGAIIEANKSFESTMKCILDLKKITYDKNQDSAKALIKKLKESKFIEPYLEDGFSKVISVLESGLTTIRNKPGNGHGSGMNKIDFEKSYAEFALHLVGTYIVFLINLYDDSIKK